MIIIYILKYLWFEINIYSRAKKKKKLAMQESIK
jgi:hypothetical protein